MTRFLRGKQEKKKNKEKMGGKVSNKGENREPPKWWVNMTLQGGKTKEKGSG